ncbi:MAG: hypothetical protein C4334_12160 [Pyrinomonas sp.]|mgnify:CR=1 FL=1|uniref:class I SAM-dependent methyltransferase n=1 Tax=Pyrinomonas sp. TaxID=2080306 RepID=UPI00332C2308
MKERLRELIKRVPVLGKPYVQRDELRAIVNELWEPPGHFYSPIPSIEEIRSHESVIFATDSRELGGIDLNESGQLALLKELTRYYGEQPFPVERSEGRRYFFENGAFSYFDAIVLYCMIRCLRPKKIIEIGSGYSSCVFLDVNELFFGNAISCTFIEPHPQLLYSLMREEDKNGVSVIARKLQDVDLRLFSALEANDILFVDSSHVAKTGSDVNRIFFEVLPVVREGVYVHFHDVFYPFEYPKEWVYQGRAWNEAYILRAFLQYNERFKIVFFNSFLESFHREILAEEMPLCLRHSSSSMIPTSAQSIWLKRVR